LIRTRSGGRSTFFRLSLIIALGLASDSARGAEQPLTDSDVVRMVAAGRPQAEILQLISVRPAEFDLSDEMIEELRAAGVSGEILAAMQRRQRETAPEKPADSNPTPGFVEVQVVLSGDGDSASPNEIYFPSVVGEDLAATLQLGPRAEDRMVLDLAVFLACRSLEHVPGLWRTASPLGRDFVSIPPHQVVAFQAGAKPVSPALVPERIRLTFDRRNGKDPPPSGWMRLALPPAVLAELEASATHNLILGVAALVGDHYLCLASARADSVSAEGGLVITGSVRTGGRYGKPFEVRLDAPPAVRKPAPPIPAPR